MTKNGILHTQNLTFGYKTILCSPANLDADEGEIICIVGRNGCGKSTLLNTLSGILPKLGGLIKLKDKDINKISLQARSRLVSYVPSRPEYLANLKVYELVSMGRSPYTNIFDKKKDIDTDIINAALDKFNLTNLQNRALWSLSDGEKQRTMICRAVVQETPIIILDEPTAFLDYYVRQLLLQELKDLSTIEKKCIIFSSHDIELSMTIATKIWYFDNGEVRQYAKNDFISQEFYQNMTVFNSTTKSCL